MGPHHAYSKAADGLGRGRFANWSHLTRRRVCARTLHEPEIVANSGIASRLERVEQIDLTLTSPSRAAE